MKKHKDEEVVSKKKPTKAESSKPEKKKVTKSSGKFAPKEGRVLGIYTPNSAKGKVAAQAAANGKISEKDAKVLAKGKNVTRIFYRIRKVGKKFGLFNFFPSKKTEGVWLFKAVGKLPGMKAPKAA